MQFASMESVPISMENCKNIRLETNANSTESRINVVLQRISAEQLWHEASYSAIQEWMNLTITSPPPFFIYNLEYV